MGFDFFKEATDNLAKAFLDNHVSADKPLSMDLPENIEEIDRVVGEAHMEGKISLFDPSKDFNKELEAVLRSKGVLPDWDLEDLALKIIERFTHRTHSWDFGLGKKQSELLAVYEKLKDRPCVKRIVELTGIDHIPYRAQLTIGQIQWIDSMRAEGKDYADIMSELPLDDPSGLLAFLNHVEETHKTTVTTVKQFQKLTNNADDEEDASIALYAAFEERYRLTLNRILREGGNYAQLDTTDPKDFHLPKVWYGNSRNMTKAKAIRRTITDYFKLNEPDPEIGRCALRDVAKQIEAPYAEVLKASHYYSDFEDETNPKDEPEAKETKE
jgi:hypothetical protein